MNHVNPPVRRATRVAFMLCAMMLTGMASAAGSAPRLSGDPRVADAVQLWAEWVEYQASVERVPGLSYGIVHDQELVASGGFGQANPATGSPATPETLYSICSISKLFTSVALMQQRDAGRLRLDDPVAQHLGWFNIEDAHPADEPVTIRGLLTHSAGLPRESDFPYWTDPDYPFPTSDQLRARLGAQQTLYPAARYFQYSNLGLSLVGEIVAAAAGQAFDPYMREHLLDPLGMRDTHTDIPVELRGGRLAIGHTALKRDGQREVVTPFQTRGIAPAAGFASSVNDLAKFAKWQFRLLGDGGEELLRASTLREMQRVHWVDPDWQTTWGLGFSVRREGERTFARHGGGCPGYYTEFRLEPKTRIGAIVLTNTIGSAPRFYAAKAFDLIAPAIEAARKAPDEAPARNAEWARYTGVYDSIWGQVAIVPWEDGLALLELQSRDPAQDLVRLQHVGEHTFRRVRKDDESLGETVYFELGEDGAVRRFQRHSIWMNKLR